MSAYIGPDSPEVLAVSQGPAENGEKVVLDRHYGAIGIPALAAALRYRGTGKNPAYAQAPDTARRDARLYDLSRI